MPRCRKPAWTYSFTDWDQVPIFLTIRETCVLLRWSDETVRKRLKDGTLRGITVSNAFLVEKQSIIDLISGKESNVS